MANDNFSFGKNRDRKMYLEKKFMAYLFYLNDFECLQFLIYLGVFLLF